MAIGTVLVLAVYLVSWATGSPTIGRVLPGVVLGAHLALVQALPRWLATEAGRPPARRARTAVVVGGLAIGLLGTAAGSIRSVPRDLLPASLSDDSRLASIVAPYEPLPAGIERDDLILASSSLSHGAVASSGKAIATSLPQPFVEDMEERRALQDRLLDLLDAPGDAAPRYAEAGIEWLVLTPSDAGPWLSSPSLAAVEVRTDDLVVFRLSSARLASEG